MQRHKKIVGDGLKCLFNSPFLFFFHYIWVLEVVEVGNTIFST